jgi:hypothetical protein
MQEGWEVDIWCSAGQDVKVERLLWSEENQRLKSVKRRVEHETGHSQRRWSVVWAL